MNNAHIHLLQTRFVQFTLHLKCERVHERVNNKITDGWIPFSCFSLTVLITVMTHLDTWHVITCVFPSMTRQNVCCEKRTHRWCQHLDALFKMAEETKSAACTVFTLVLVLMCPMLLWTENNGNAKNRNKSTFSVKDYYYITALENVSERAIFITVLVSKSKEVVHWHLKEIWPPPQKILKHKI